jgi:basic membrane protein A and related proteins
MRAKTLVLLLGLSLVGCKKPEGGTPGKPAEPAQKQVLVGLVTDIGGRGDQSFNDSALRGLETWAAKATFKGGKYEPLGTDVWSASIPKDLAGKVEALSVKPMVVQSKAQEDYQPNLLLLIDQGAELTIGVGFMLENAVEAVAKANPKARFLLIDSPILDAKGAPQKLPNVRTVVFREEEGSFLVGALAGLVAKEKVGFVGGMEIPLIKKFEAGFRAGVKSTNPRAQVLVSYTGSFDNVAAGKQVGQDFLAKGAEVVFQAAGSDGLGVLQAVKEAREAGKTVWGIGVDSDQHHLAPNAMLTSMVKRVDLAVYEATRDVARGTFAASDIVMGVKEGAVAVAEVRNDFPGKAEALAKVEALRAKIVSGELKVPSNLVELEAFRPAP